MLRSSPRSDSPSPSPRSTFASSSVSLPRTYKRQRTIRSNGGAASSSIHTSASPEQDGGAASEGVEPIQVEGSEGKRRRTAGSRGREVDPGSPFGAARLKSAQRPATRSLRSARGVEGSDSSTLKSNVSSKASIVKATSTRPGKAKSQKQIETHNNEDDQQQISTQEAPTTPRANRHRSSLAGFTPKDLSACFSPDSPSKLESRSHLRSPSRRQMLGKTKSLERGSAQSSRTKSPASSLINRTRSLPSTPSKSASGDSPSRLLFGVSATEDVGSQPASSPGGSGGAKRIYGANRTVRAAVTDRSVWLGMGKGKEKEVIEEVDDLAIPETASYADLRKRYEVINEMGEDGGEGNLVNDLLLARPPQAVSDMRSKGENRIFIDEVDYLVEGLAGRKTPLKIRQSSSVEILRQMRDEGWLGRAQVCGQIDRLWASIWGARAEEDEVLDGILLAFLAIISPNDNIVESFWASHAKEILGLFPVILKRTATISSSTVKRDIIHEVFTGMTSVAKVPSTATEIWPKLVVCQLLAQACHERSELVTRTLPSDTKLLSSVLAFLEYTHGATSEIKDQAIPHCVAIIRFMAFESALQQKYLLDRASKWSSTLFRVTLNCVKERVTDLQHLFSPSEADWITLNDALQLLAMLVAQSPDWTQEAVSNQHLLSAMVLVAFTAHERLVNPINDLPDREDDAGTESGFEPDLNPTDAPTSNRERAVNLVCVVLAMMISLITKQPERLGHVIQISACEKCMKKREFSSKNSCSCKKNPSSTIGRRLVHMYGQQISRGSDGPEESDVIIGGYLALLVTILTVGDDQGDGKATRLEWLDSIPGDEGRVEKMKLLRDQIRPLEGLQSTMMRIIREQRVDEGKAEMIRGRDDDDDDDDDELMDGDDTVDEEEGMLSDHLSKLDRYIMSISMRL